MKVIKISYLDLIGIPTGNSTEPLVRVDSFDNQIRFGYEGSLGGSGLPSEIVVRMGVARRLAMANKNLQEKNPHLCLKVAYGYRPLAIQKQYFKNVCNKLIAEYDFSSRIDLLEAAHRFIAVPTVAGHPTGGAVDVSIVDKKNGQSIDFGSQIDDFSDEEKMTWFSESITSDQRNNREILGKIMLAAGFAPFWGEWWHYSYGDHEWAAYFEKERSIYDYVLSCPNLALAVDRILDEVLRARCSCVYAAAVSG